MQLAAAQQRTLREVPQRVAALSARQAFPVQQHGARVEFVLGQRFARPVRDRAEAFQRLGLVAEVVVEFAPGQQFVQELARAFALDRRGLAGDAERRDAAVVEVGRQAADGVRQRGVVAFRVVVAEPAVTEVFPALVTGPAAAGRVLDGRDRMIDQATRDCLVQRRRQVERLEPGVAGEGFRPGLGRGPGLAGALQQLFHERVAELEGAGVTAPVARHRQRAAGVHQPEGQVGAGFEVAAVPVRERRHRVQLADGQRAAVQQPAQRAGRQRVGGQVKQQPLPKGLELGREVARRFEDETVVPVGVVPVPAAEPLVDQ